MNRHDRLLQQLEMRTAEVEEYDFVIESLEAQGAILSHDNAPDADHLKLVQNQLEQNRKQRAIACCALRSIEVMLNRSS